jgi:predicted ABC-type ATPase
MSPEAILICGANGAGKTTFARQLVPVLYPGIGFLNVDEIQQEDKRFSDLVAAGREFLDRLGKAELARQNFAVETTLASRTYLARVRRWKAYGYRVTLHFIEVPSADFALARVAARAALGGHDVPETDVRRRFERGRQLFFGVYQPLVSEWYHWVSDENGLRFVEGRRND